MLRVDSRFDREVRMPAYMFANVEVTDAAGYER